MQIQKKSDMTQQESNTQDKTFLRDDWRFGAGSIREEEDVQRKGEKKNPLVLNLHHPCILSLFF